MRCFLIVILVGISIFSFAEKTVSRATYEAEVDKLNCELAKFYMEKNQGVYALSDYEDSLAMTGCNFEHLMVFIKERQPAMEINGELAVYIESFKLEYDDAVNNNVLHFKLTDIFNQPALDKYSTDEDYINLKNSLINNLEKKLKINEIGNPVNQEVSEQESFSEQFDDFGWEQATLILISILIIFIFISLISWFYKSNKTASQTQVSVQPNPTNPTNPTNPISNSAKTINDLHAKPQTVVNLPAQNIVIPTAISNLPPTPIINKPIDEIIDTIEEEDEELPNENIFYMPYPSIDGSFYEYGKHDTYEEGKSTFRFEIRLKEYSLATFEVISNQDVITDALMNFEKTLNAVCEVVGEGTEHDKNHEIIIKPGLKEIVTVEEGTVQLKTQHWRLKQKAKIKLIY